MKPRLPTLPDLIARLQDVETQLAQLEARTAGSTELEQGGIFAHRAALLRKKHWYLGHIRAHKPVEPLQADVFDDIHTDDGPA